MRKSTKELMNLLKAKDPLIYIQSYEEHEAISELCDAIRHTTVNMQTNPSKVFCYTRTQGMQELDIQNPDTIDFNKVNKDIRSYKEAFEYIKQLQYDYSPVQNDLRSMIRGNNNQTQQQQEVKKNFVPTYFIFPDLHLYLNDKDILRCIRELKEVYKQKNYCPIIVVSPVMEIPPELEKLFTLYELPLMTTEEVKDKIKGIMEKLRATEDDIQAVACAATGLTNREIDRALLHSLVKNDKRTIKAEDIHEEKLQIVKKSGVLDFILPTHDINDLGGCSNFKSWIKKVKKSLEPGARKFGIPQPKGAMLVGVPGTSKSVSAEILASYLNIPLLSLDMSKIMGSLVGSSERNIANALRIAKSISPCVLLLDELEKGMGGVQSSNRSDSGALARVMSQLLTFMTQDNTGVITLCTSNNVVELPPEMLRSGRLDAQFLFDLPTAKERREIINIYLKKNDLACSEDDLDNMIERTENFTGAEIRSAVTQMLINCYYRQTEASDEAPVKVLNKSDIDTAIDNTVTVYRSSKERIDAFRAFSAGRYLNASGPEDREEPVKATAVRTNPFNVIAPAKKKVTFTAISGKE